MKRRRELPDWMFASPEAPEYDDEAPTFEQVCEVVREAVEKALDPECNTWRLFNDLDEEEEAAAHSPNLSLLELEAIPYEALDTVLLRPLFTRSRSGATSWEAYRRRCENDLVFLWRELLKASPNPCETETEHSRVCA